MTPDQLINHYGTIRKCATELKVTYQCVHIWKSTGVIPRDVQYKIEVLTQEKLKADRNHDFSDKKGSPA